MTPETRSPGAVSAVAEAGRPQSVKSLLGREQVLYGSRRYGAALGILDAVLARSDLTGRQRFEALTRKAACLEQLRRPAAALAVIRNTARGYRDDPLAQSLLGEYLYRIAGDFRGALRALGRAAALDPRDPDTRWWMGQVYQRGLNRPVPARKACLKAIEADQRYAPALDSLAELAEMEGRFIEAVDWTKAHYIVARTPADLATLSELYLKLGNPEAAVKYGRLAARRDPRAPRSWLALALALARADRTRAAANALKAFMSRASRRNGPFLSGADLACLEAVLDLPCLKGLREKLPVSR
jgi:tetratricopeptide (TPR) repeat protein